MKRIRQEIRVAGYILILAGLSTVGVGYRALRIHHAAWKAVTHGGHSED